MQPSTTHLSDELSPMLRAPSGISEAIKDASEFNASAHRTAQGARRDNADEGRSFDLHQDELTGTLSEYEIDCAKRRGRM